MIYNNTKEEAIITAISDLAENDDWSKKTITIFRNECGEWIVDHEEEYNDDDDDDFDDN